MFVEFLTEASGTTELTVAGLVFASLLAVVHVFAGAVPFGTDRSRQRWLSAAGGASVAYVFVLLFPEVSEIVLEVADRGFFLEKFVTLFALLGFVVFYGVEVFVAQERREEPEESPLVFYGHVATFGAYNVLIGYLLVYQERPGLANLTLYALAMAFHFLVNDASLRRHHGDLYVDFGRWVLAGAVLAGALIALVLKVNELLVAVLFAFLAGSIVFNVVKDEVPSVEESKFFAFSVGAAAYAIVLVLL
ncbi:hypothetical protein [Haloarchaeobius sp. DFWS5]|uniref:hypothetical protein n=1 Tax=Haloarchaeobius sp. DFWS5 TaxID=3446114 RepID=UPI003EBAF949